MISDQEYQSLSIPPKIKQAYSDLQLVATTSYYKVFEATNRSTYQRHTIRVLDTESEFYLKDRNFASTLFIQELLYIATRFSENDVVIIENFEISGEYIGYVTKPTYSLKTKLEDVARKSPINIEKLFDDTLSNLEFLFNTLKFTNSTVKADTIIQFEECDGYFIADWADCSLSDEKSLEMSSYLGLDAPGTQQIFDLATIILEVTGINKQDIKFFKNLKDEELYTSSVFSITENIKPKNFQKLIQRSLIKDPETHLTLERYFQEVPHPRRSHIGSHSPESKVSGIICHLSA